MGSIGTPELIVVAVLALLVFGPKRLPEIGKNVGAAIREFRRASRDLMSHFEDDDPPRVRSVSRHNYDADAYTPPAAVPTHEEEMHPALTAETDHHAAETDHHADVHTVAASQPSHNGDHSSHATPEPAHAGEAVAATTSTTAHHAPAAESERNA
jgi:TatA/E family protein of Tat protein translocase